MCWAVKARKMNIWLSYGNYLPQNLSEMTFYLGIVLGSILAFLFILGILLVSRVKHCVVSCPVRIPTFSPSFQQPFCLVWLLDINKKHLLYPPIFQAKIPFLWDSQSLLCTICWASSVWPLGCTELDQ
jgi:hypothetical protein